MNSELKENLQKLKDLRDRLELRIEELKAKYTELRNKTDKSQKEYDEMNTVKEFYTNLEKDLEVLKNNLKQINDINEDLNIANKEYLNTIGTPEENNLLEERKRIYDELCKYVNESYNDFEDLVNSNLELPIKEKFKLNKKVKIGLSVVAILTVLGVGSCTIRNTIDNIKNTDTNLDNSEPNKDDNTKTPTNDTKVSIPELDNEVFNEITKVESEEELPEKAANAFGVLNAINPDHYTLEDVTNYLRNKNGLGVENTNTQKPTTSEETPKQEETLGFTDVRDEEQVAKRANEIMNDLNTNAPGHNYTIEEIENFIKLINNGVVDETTQDALFHNEVRIEGIWNKENGMEVDVPFDTSKLFLDGSLGQQLAKKIYESRINIMNNVEDPEAYRKAAEEFTVLFVNSWYLNGGNNEISAYETETAFGRAVLDSYFLNTYALIHIEDVKVIVNENEFILREEAEKADYMSCGTRTVIADNGEEVEQQINKFTSDMLGAEMELTRIKEESYTLSK